MATSSSLPQDDTCSVLTTINSISSHGSTSNPNSPKKGEGEELDPFASELALPKNPSPSPFPSPSPSSSTSPLLLRSLSSGHVSSTYSPKSFSFTSSRRPPSPVPPAVRTFTQGATSANHATSVTSPRFRNDTSAGASSAGTTSAITDRSASVGVRRLARAMSADATSAMKSSYPILKGGIPPLRPVKSVIATSANAPLDRAIATSATGHPGPTDAILPFSCATSANAWDVPAGNFPVNGGTSSAADAATALENPPGIAFPSGGATSANTKSGEDNVPAGIQPVGNTTLVAATSATDISATVMSAQVPWTAPAVNLPLEAVKSAAANVRVPGGILPFENTTSAAASSVQGQPVMPAVISQLGAATSTVNNMPGGILPYGDATTADANLNAPGGESVLANGKVFWGCSSSSPFPPFGSVALCGRRREMEDRLAIMPCMMGVPKRGMGTKGCGEEKKEEGEDEREEKTEEQSEKEMDGSEKEVEEREEARVSEEEEQEQLHFFAVYDGHGGSEVAAFCAKYLHLRFCEYLKELIREPSENQISNRIKIENQIQIQNQNQNQNRNRNGNQNQNQIENQSQIPKQIESALKSSFLRLDADLAGQSGDMGPLVAETVGTTAVISIVTESMIVTANCGDSRVVLGRGGRQIALSSDHKPNRDDERERIEAAGGRVIFWEGTHRLMGVLAMSRAIGDRFLKPFVSPHPELNFVERSEDDEFLILASDGLWDVLSNDLASEIVRKCFSIRQTKENEVQQGPPTAIAAALLGKLAISRGSSDNVSVVVVDLRRKSDGPI